MRVSLSFVHLSFLLLCLFQFLLFSVLLVLLLPSSRCPCARSCCCLYHCTCCFWKALDVSGLRKQENCLSAVEENRPTQHIRRWCLNNTKDTVTHSGCGICGRKCRKETLQHTTKFARNNKQIQQLYHYKVEVRIRTIKRQKPFKHIF